MCRIHCQEKFFCHNWKDVLHSLENSQEELLHLLLLHALTLQDRIWVAYYNNFDYFDYLAGLKMI